MQVNHIAIQVKSKKDELFFAEILGMKKVGDFRIDSHLVKAIFKKRKAVDVVVFAKDNVKVELFITGRKAKSSFNHICLEIQDKKSFIEKCKKHGVATTIVERKGRKLLFVRDFSGNLFEIKQVASQ